jgi:hypothetical protein
MANKNHFLSGILGVFLVFITLLLGCSNPAGSEDDDPDPAAEMAKLGAAGIWNKSVDSVRWSFKIANAETGDGWLSKIGTYSQEPATFSVEDNCTKLRIVFADAAIDDEVYAYRFDYDVVEGVTKIYLVLTIDGTEQPFETRTGSPD